MDIDLVVSLISKVRRDSYNYLEKELEAAEVEGIIASHGSVLGVLFHNGGELKMKEIAELIGRDKSTITYLVKGLVDAGYIIRKKGHTDSRETYISLTTKAWNIQSKIMEVSEKLIQTAYIGFTDYEKQKITSLLHKMDKNFLDNL